MSAGLSSDPIVRFGVNVVGRRSLTATLLLPALTATGLVLAQSTVTAAEAAVAPMVRVQAVSVNTAGVPTNQQSQQAVSDDGRLALFTTNASGVTPDQRTDTSGGLFLRDTVAGTTRLVSTDSQGRAASGGHAAPVISGDGRWIGWQAQHSDLVSPPAAADRRLMLKDLTTGALQIIAGPFGSDSAHGTRAEVTPKLMSRDGRWVAADLRFTVGTPGQYETQQAALYDSLERRWIRLGGQGPDRRITAMSGDARVIAFSGSDDRTGNLRPYLYDRLPRQLREVPAGPAGEAAEAGYTRLSDDGKVLFSNWDRDPDGYEAHVVIRRTSDLAVVGQLRQPGLHGVADADRTGRHVLIVQSRTGVVPSYGVNPDAYRLDRTTGQRVRVTVDNAGAPIRGYTSDFALTPDARHVLFISEAGLTPGDVPNRPLVNSDQDAFLATLS